MADLARRRTENVEGPWFVDTTCIDCGTCMWMAPEVFAEADGMSAVHHQPPDQDERASAALVACPTGSIGGPATKVDFPRPIQGRDDVWHCGFHDRSSFGAASYIVRTEEGNVMVDVPRFARPLVKRIEAMGGLAAIVMTHRDDIGAHQDWHEWFDAPRAIHRDDAVFEPEIRLDGEGGTIAGLDWLHVPGHTKGHVIYRHDDVLLTGDHLAGSVADPHRLRAFRRACWYDWDAQQQSMELHTDWDITHVLPGHGAPWSGTADGYRDAMRSLRQWMATA